MKITHMRHIGLAAPNLDELAEFYARVWGVHPVGRDSDTAYLRGTGPESFILSLHRREKAGIDHIALGVEDRAALGAAAAAAEKAGCRVLGRPAPLAGPGGGTGFRFVDPDGRTIELSCEVSPAAAQDWAAKVKPTKISHVVLNTPDLKRMEAFYTGVLGFRISDWSEDVMVFLRCNADHHSIAFSVAPHASLNHVAYEVPGVDDVMRGIGNLKRHDRKVIWGPGRHTPIANNVFAYFQDPAGFVIEYTCDLGQIVDEASYRPQVLKRDPELIDTWGTAGPPPPEARAAMVGTPDPGYAGR